MAILAAYFLAVNALIMRHRVCNVYLLGVCLCVVSQLQDYKTIAQSLERRIVDLHNDCEKKEQEITQLKAQLKSK